MFIFITPVYAKEKVKYSSCIDGDTIKVLINNEKVTVRLLAVNAPETAKENKEAEYYANEASDFTCNKIKKAKKIELEYDPKSDKHDKYDRLLAWVFVDGELLETALVKGGYAKVAYLYDDYKYADILKEEQELASAKKIGIWNDLAKAKYENKEPSTTDKEKETYEDYTNKEIIIIVIIFLIITFISKLFKTKRK